MGTLRKILGKNYNRFGGHIKFDKGEYVTTTDGVGTKSLLASNYSSIGHDVVNHCVNDLLCEFAEPIAFTNYIGMPKKNVREYSNLIEGMTTACQYNNCSLIGGETAIMDDIYKTQALSVVGTLIGKKFTTRQAICTGDQIIGLPSSGLHTNGYTIARKVLKNKMGEPYREGTIRDRLLVPHKTYFNEIGELYDKRVQMKAICHITGGGWCNLYRTISNDVDFDLELNYKIERIFKLVSSGMNSQQAFSEFNMGIGMIVIVKKMPDVSFEHYILGKVAPGDGEVRINGKALLRESY